MSGRALLFVTFLITTALYCGMAATTTFIVGQNREGCERGNHGLRLVVIHNTRSALESKLPSAPTRQFKQSLTDLTTGANVNPDGTVDCAAAYAFPMPWLGQS